jgi:RNA polymerase sigma-70 factor (ECF subfamily)
MITDREPDDIPMGETADAGNPEALTGNRDMIEHIKRLAADLPDTQRLVFTLRDIQDLTIEEVCEYTGLSSESVRSNLHYARKRLRERLEREYDMQRRMP